MHSRLIYHISVVTICYLTWHVTARVGTVRLRYCYLEVNVTGQVTARVGTVRLRYCYLEVNVTWHVTARVGTVRLRYMSSMYHSFSCAATSLFLILLPSCNQLSFITSQYHNTIAWRVSAELRLTANLQFEKFANNFWKICTIAMCILLHRTCVLSFVRIGEKLGVTIWKRLTTHGHPDIQTDISDLYYKSGALRCLQ